MKRLERVFGFALLLFAASCANETSSDSPCSPATLPCPCADGTSGTRFCMIETAEYGSCVCDGDAGGGNLDVDSRPDVEGQACSSDSDCNPDGPSGFECVAGRCEALVDWNPGPTEEDMASWDLVGESGSTDAQLPFGEALGEYCGVPAYSNGIGTSFGHSVGSTIFGLRWQCTEYALRFLCLTYPDLGCAEAGKQGSYGNAKYWFDNPYNNPVLAQLTRFENGGTEPPRAGDVLVLGGAGFGHVAIIREVTDSTVAVIEQNTSRTRADAFKVHRMQVSDGRYTIRGAIGWLRAPGSPPQCADQMPSLVSPADGASFVLGNEVRLTWALGENDEEHFVKVRELATDTVVLLENIGATTSYVFTPPRTGEYRWTAYYRSDRCPNNECAASARVFNVIPPVDACSDNFCRSNGHSSGTYCDGAEVVECGREGDCLVEQSRTLCSGDDVCESGACTEPAECSPASPCPEPAVGSWSTCSGYSNACDETGSRSRTVTRYSCESGSCDAATSTESDTAGCNRDTDGDSCDGGVCEGGRCIDSCTEPWRIENNACNSYTSEGRTLVACAELIGSDRVRFRVRKVDGTEFLSSRTIHIRVGDRDGDDCPNVSRGSATITEGATSVDVSFDLVAGSWPAGQTKAFFATIFEEGGGQCYRYSRPIEITRLCVP